MIIPARKAPHSLPRVPFHLLPRSRMSDDRFTNNQHDDTPRASADVVPINPGAPVVREGEPTATIPATAGVQNLDGSHMDPGIPHIVPEWFAVRLITGNRAHRVAE